MFQAFELNDINLLRVTFDTFCDWMEIKVGNSGPLSPPFVMNDFFLLLQNIKGSQEGRWML